METAITSAVLGGLVGPASGVFVSLVLIYLFGWFLVKYLLPQQEANFNRMLEDSRLSRVAFAEESDANRKTFESAIKVMSERLYRVEEDLVDIKDFLEDESTDGKPKRR